MAILKANPANLAGHMKNAKPGDEIELASGRYAGLFTTGAPGAPNARITVRAAQGAQPVFSGADNSVASLVVNQPYWTLEDLLIEPTAKPNSAKPVWLNIRPGGAHAIVRRVTLARDADVKAVKPWNDFGIVVAGDHVLLEDVRAFGMVKGIQIQGGCIRPRLRRCHVGPTYQSTVVVTTSYGIVRGADIDLCRLEDSYIEDAIQWMHNYDLTGDARIADVSALGTIVRRTVMRGCGENALDFKGAGLVVVDGCHISRMAGSNDGPLAGWNYNAVAAVTRGSGASCDNILLRNTTIEECASGVRLLPSNWTIIHNDIQDNNWRPERSDYAGFGIRAPGGARGASIINNAIGGHLGGNIIAPDGIEFVNNPTEAGLPAYPLTETRSAGSGIVVPLGNARYFTDWFGLTDIPLDRIVIGGQLALVTAVNYANQTVTLDRPLQWDDRAPVYLGSDRAVTGVLPDYSQIDGPDPEPDDPDEPPITEPDEGDAWEAGHSLTLTGPAPAIATIRELVQALGGLSIKDNEK